MTVLIVDSQAAPESVSVAVVTAVAEVLDRDPATIGPLYDAIDPDALDRLFASTNTTARKGAGQVMFSVEGCEVTVYANGRLEVVDPDTLSQVRASD